MQAILSGSTKITRRCEILNSDGTIWRPDVPILSGSVSVDASRDERRGCDIVLGFRGLGDSDLRVAEGEFWYDKLIRLYRGVKTPNLWWECPLGTFMPDSIASEHFPRTISVSGRDLTKRLLTSKLTEPAMFPAGTDVGDLVRYVAAVAGIVNVILPWDTDNPAPKLDDDTTFDSNTSRFEMIKNILLGFNCEVYFDRNAYMIVRPFQDPASTPPSWVFKTGKDGGNLATWTKTVTDARLFNHVVVEGGDDSTVPVYAEAKVTDERLSVHEYKIGDRLMDPIQSVTANTPELAQALADSQLKYAALEEFAVQLGAIVIPWLEAGNVIQFLDPDPTAEHDPTTFFLHDFSIPLDLTPMDLNADRVVLIS